MTKHANVKLTKPQKSNNQQLPPTAEDIRELQNIDPSLRRFIEGEMHKIRQADKRRRLAVLRLLEFVVSGMVPRPAGEDDTVTVCRLISNGARDLNVSRSMKRKINKALAPFKRRNRWTAKTEDVVRMREWRGPRAATRAIVLIVLVGETCGHGEMQKWLENPNPNFDGKTPIDFVLAQKWKELADHLDAVVLAQ